ncbi:MAG: cytochrome P450 [Cytophagales bacterium]|nr:cytochrome P450 [Armatimonadota bacterium]
MFQQLIPATLHDRCSLAPFEEAAHADSAEIVFFGRKTLLVNHPDLIHELLVEKATAFRKGPLLSVNARPLLGKGLLTGPNDLNRRQRRVISPAFAHKKVAEYAPIIARYAQQRVAGWREDAPVDVPTEMTAITLGIIGELLLSVDLLGASEGVGEAITILMNFAIDQQRAPVRAVLSAGPTLRALLFINRTLYQRIEQRRRRGTGASGGEADLLSRLLFATDDVTGGAYMSDKLVRDEAMTLFLGGLETVAMGLTWSLFLLAAHPHTADRAHAEVDAVLGERQVADLGDLEQLPYLQGVFKEALRLYPPAYIIARQALLPVMLGGRRLRRGQVVFASPYVQHRREENFSRPLQFDPLRWQDPDAERQLPHRYAFMPFGGGPRVCVGGHFAYMESHLILATVLRQVRLSLVPGQKAPVPEPLFTLRPRDGLILQGKRRG